MTQEDTNKIVIEKLLELLAFKDCELYEKDSYIKDLETELGLRKPHD